MTTRFLCLLSILVFTGSLSGETQSKEENAFANGVRKYVELQQYLEGSVSAQKSTNESEQITYRQQQLAGLIANARLDAYQGEVFTRDVAEQFHKIIRKAFRETPQIHARRAQTGDQQRRAGAEERAGRDRWRRRRCAAISARPSAANPMAAMAVEMAPLKAGGFRGPPRRKVARQQAALGDPRQPAQRPPDADHRRDQRTRRARGERHRRDVQRQRRRPDRADPPRPKPVIIAPA